MYARFLARALWESVFSHLVGSLVVTTPRGAAFRRYTLIFVGGTAWAVLAYSRHPYVPNSYLMLSFLEYPFRALFAPDVFKHVLVAGLVFWLAYRAAAIYLDDMFELKDVNIAEKFIRQSAFASQYDVIEIKEGDVAPKDQKSPIFLIGGPGKVRVYLENAAVFERIGGMPHVIEPTTQKRGSNKSNEKPENNSWIAQTRGLLGAMIRVEEEEEVSVKDGSRFLESFERLRQVIDLRDQVQEMSVEGRTRDGIPIQAKNLRIIFSVYRDGKEATLSKPYPFSQDAVETLVYGLGRTHWTNAMASQIRRELGAFIARHTLSEFLAAVGQPELKQATEFQTEMMMEADRLVGINGSYEIKVENPPPFVPRPGISDLFYDFDNFVTRTRERGVELRWIGLGTWTFPSEIIPERHLQAWRISYENLARGSRAAYKSITVSSQAEQLAGIVRETPIGIHNQLEEDGIPRKLHMANIVISYRTKLTAALETYERHDQLGTKNAQTVRQVRDHLFWVITEHP
ncbi:MAG: hypothetical protein ACWGN2_09325 [Anaerolineales bacterium]